MHARARTDGVSTRPDGAFLVVRTPQGVEHRFEVEPFRKQCLLGGLDEIGLTLRHRDEIAAFEARRLAARPWLKRELAA